MSWATCSYPKRRGDPSDPVSFQPIALTSTIGKVFHKILANCLQKYLLSNKVIDTSLQKGFLSGVYEHIFTLIAIIDNAKEHYLPLSNAFGSVSHQLIIGMLKYIQLPSNFVSYVSNIYSKLSATVKTKQWCSPTFSISQGIFQGDTLFLLAFNPIIELCNLLPSTGFKMDLKIPNSEDLPPVGLCIYVDWDFPNHDDPTQGWYLATVLDHHINGLSVIQYPNGRY